MTVKTYHATTIQQALSKVKQELGEDAVILNTRAVARRRFLGLRRKQAWEMTAVAPDRPATVPTVAPAPSAEPVAPPAPPANSTFQLLDDSPAMPPQVQAPGPDGGQSRRSLTENRLAALLEEVSELKKSVRLISGSLPPEIRGPGGKLYGELVGHGFLPDLAEELLMAAYAKSSDGRDCRDKLRSLVAASIRIEPPREWLPHPPRVVMMTGAAGVGKTTAAAKIAGHARVRTESRVAMISTDSVRVGGQEQLFRLGQLMDVPVFSCSTIDDFQSRLDLLADFDLVVVDTPGLSPADPSRLRRIEAMAEACDARVHMVIPATNRSEEVARTVSRLRHLTSGLTIFTRFDEAELPGFVASEAVRNDLTVTFVSDGPRVPADIRPASADELARYVLPAAHAKWVG